MNAKIMPKGTYDTSWKNHYINHALRRSDMVAKE